MSTQCVKVTISDGIAYVQLNRPEKMNAINYLMFSELDRTIKKIQKNRAIRVVILSGAGGNFSSGLDVKSVMSAPMQAVKLLFKWLPGNANLLSAFPLAGSAYPSLLLPCLMDVVLVVVCRLRSAQIYVLPPMTVNYRLWRLSGG